MTTDDRDETPPTGVQLTSLDQEFQRDPAPALERLRRLDPVHFDSVLNRYVLTRNADIDALLWDRSLSVDPRKAAPGTFETMFVSAGYEGEQSMLLSDPPYHTRLRSLVTKAFSAKAIAAMGPRIQELVDELLDAVDGPGVVDLIASLAGPLPTIVIAEMLGVDPARRADFKRWSDLGVMNFNPLLSHEERAKVAEAGAALDAYFRGAIAERREHPRKDLITLLVTAEENGDHLTEDEIVRMCGLLLAAGNVTTTDLIGNGVLALLQNPGEIKKLHNDPALIKNAVEEMLRYDPPVTQTGRISLSATQVDGVTIAEGQSITPMLAAANRDPEAHADPDRFDITRSDVEHHSFGGGVHYCLGAPLARLEAQLAVGTLIRRFPGIRLAGEQLEWRRVPGFRGLVRLPVHLRQEVESWLHPTTAS